jgi:bla regulator protein blaR1
MVVNYLLGIRATVAPAVANHVWQSTLFAMVAALLTLMLRKNQARARYWLWLAASIKFLIPFSLLVALGSFLAMPSATLCTAPAGGFYAAVQEVATVSGFLTVGISRAPKPTEIDRLVMLMPVLVSGVWLCGFVLVLFVWWRRWRCVSRACWGATPLQTGREVEALRRLERLGGVRKRIEVFLSRVSLEPGVFGIVRPVLVWPAGISQRLEDAQLEAILAHEVGHVRRRDNLAALMHMVVEAVFWFHPLVWWLGARLVEERERACDEEALRLGSEPQVYAASILKACEFCVGSPLACVSGVTGADLKKRIVRIMTQHGTRKLDFRRKLLLGVAGLLSIAVPIGFGLARPGVAFRSAPAAEPAGITGAKFEVASIKPHKPSDRRKNGMFFSIMSQANAGTFYATGPTLRMLIRLAYDIQDSQILGGPKWINHDRFDIQAKADSSVDAELRKLTPGQARLVKLQMLQSLLADRFKLTLHHETRNMPIYALVVAKNGPKLQESKITGVAPGRHLAGGPGGPMIRVNFGGAEQEMTSLGTPIGFLAQILAQQLGRTVVDKTGLNGRYDFTLKWTPDIRRGQILGGPGPVGGPGQAEGGGSQSMAGIPGAPGSSGSSSDSSGPSIFTAVQQQLGLRLKPEKGPIDVLVIDQVEPPTQN